ncbi:MAG TPA: hypothetical protein VK612_00725, partial [Pyrinomonadaceae bacterium]|nr:hypothetical protein [Pyrinomonadaceae bacterium]
PTPTPVKVVVTDNMPAIKPPSPRPTPTPIIVGATPGISSRPVVVTSGTSIQPAATPATQSVPATTPLSGLTFPALTFRQMKNKIAEAKRQMQTRPIATASSEGTMMTEFVRVAFNDSRTNEIDYVVLAKDAFLSVPDEKVSTSQNGRQLRIRTIRGNGVNTPIVLIDERGETHVPLLVQYPVVREGKYIETAYYMSTHPGLVTPEVVNAGRFYVRNVIEIARDRLKEKGIVINAKLADIAERLATVEHVDHLRFRTEPHSDIFNDIFTLYALNEGQTYRYSVSSAGAGGMVQMIPSTYRMVRSWHSNVPLMPDFVEGMRNHVNASEAMLLYMQRTWNDLIASPTVAEAFSTGMATQEQLMAAGYNSNPARIAGYIKRGGENWTSLIPRETKIYLQIYDSIERNVPMTARTR